MSAASSVAARREMRRSLGISSASPPHHSHGRAGMARRSERRACVACFVLPKKHPGRRRQWNTYDRFSEHQHGHLRIPDRSRGKRRHSICARSNRRPRDPISHVLLLLRKRSACIRSSACSAARQLKLPAAPVSGSGPTSMTDVNRRRYACWAAAAASAMRCRTMAGRFDLVCAAVRCHRAGDGTAIPRTAWTRRDRGTGVRRGPGMRMAPCGPHDHARQIGAIHPGSVRSVPGRAVGPDRFAVGRHRCPFSGQRSREPASLRRAGHQRCADRRWIHGAARRFAGAWRALLQQCLVRGSSARQRFVPGMHLHHIGAGHHGSPGRAGRSSPTAMRFAAFSAILQA